MDVMKLKLVWLALGALLAAAGSAQAQNFSYGAGLTAPEQTLRYGVGLKDQIPAPIPIPVPAPMPVPEGFTYYLRADLNWAFAREPSFSETGAQYGPGLLPYSGLSNRSVSIDDIFGGTIGFGAYFTPRFRGDLTLDFRGQQSVDARATYVAGPAAGVVTDTLKTSSVVGLANVYWDILPRGRLSPYIGAGFGFVYNDTERTHRTTDDTGIQKSGTSKDQHTGWAGALMAGVTFAFDHRWALDVGYRALYLDGGSVTTVLNTTETSKATFGDHWEHQIRVGLRINIW
jgi:opacity protein-like surface antigen